MHPSHAHWNRRTERREPGNHTAVTWRSAGQARTPRHPGRLHDISHSGVAVVLARQSLPRLGDRLVVNTHAGGTTLLCRVVNRRFIDAARVIVGCRRDTTSGHTLRPRGPKPLVARPPLRIVIPRSRRARAG